MKGTKNTIIAKILFTSNLKEILKSINTMKTNKIIRKSNSII